MTSIPYDAAIRLIVRLLNHATLVTREPREGVKTPGGLNAGTVAFDKEPIAGRLANCKEIWSRTCRDTSVGSGLRFLYDSIKNAVMTAENRPPYESNEIKGKVLRESIHTKTSSVSISSLYPLTFASSPCLIICALCSHPSDSEAKGPSLVLVCRFMSV